MAYFIDLLTGAFMPPDRPPDTMPNPGPDTKPEASPDTMPNDQPPERPTEPPPDTMPKASPDDKSETSPNDKSEVSPDSWQTLFIAALRQTGNVSEAAREAGQRRSAVYTQRRNCPVFAADWEDAIEEAADRLELTAVRRALDGTPEARFFGGEMVGSINRYSDRLLMFLLQARRPWQFDSRFRGKVPAIEEDDNRIRAEIERKMARLADGLASSETSGISDGSEPD